MFFRLVNIVWLKKDLRLTDHAPFYFAAAAQQPFVVLYCFEPALQAADSFGLRHWWAAWQSLVDMQHRLATYGLPLYIAHADAITVLAHLHKHQAIRTIWSHQETGIALTYERDQTVAQFCAQNGITWHQYAADGIERGLKIGKAGTNAADKPGAKPPTNPIFNSLFPRPIVCRLPTCRPTLANPRRLSCPTPTRPPSAKQPLGNGYTT
ncbi:MAG: deoxyribodipyrimidine photo-lyase [Sphingobacteriales bacterium]|nr:deoxyribodipyrimidine photo-lyase [Sphingobacteriales bacterium]